MTQMCSAEWIWLININCYFPVYYCEAALKQSVDDLCQIIYKHNLIWAAIHIIQLMHLFYFSNIIQGEASEMIPVNRELSGELLSKLLGL